MKLAVAGLLRIAGRLVAFVVFSAMVVLLLLTLAGKFDSKVRGAASTASPEKTAQRFATVEIRRQPLTETAVGTISAVHKISIGSKLLARVTEAKLAAGQKVAAGEVLIRLDDSDLRAKFQQAKAAVAAAEAVYQQAIADERRYAELVRSNTVSRQQYEAAATAVRSSEADLRRAREAVNEVQAMLDWATIRSPIDGTIVDKNVDAGDLVSPGQVLVTLYDPSHMQLVASVRESLAHRLSPGQQVPVRLDALDKQCFGTVSEVVPEAESRSRSFQVKVTGPCPSGIYSGMFGRIQIPLDDEELLVIPQRAVRRVGQLELVDVAEGNGTVRRAIRTGRSLGEEVEVLSGLRAGEQVAVPEARSIAQETHHE